MEARRGGQTEAYGQRGAAKKRGQKNHGGLRISARKQGARQRLREKGPNVKRRRVTEVVETPKLGE